MLQSFKFLAAVAVAILAGFTVMPAVSHAESAKTTKSESMTAEKKTQASSDDFEENRKLHMQKSKENNTKKEEK